MVSPCQAALVQEDATPPTPRASHLPDTVFLELWQVSRFLFSARAPVPGRSAIPSWSKSQPRPEALVLPFFRKHGSSTFPLCAFKWDSIPHKPVSNEGLLKYDYRGHRCPTVVQWHLWCDGSFTISNDPPSKTTGLFPKAGWACVIQAQTSLFVESAAILALLQDL